MKKKGFTLIELLAVVVILAIVALIATPIVLNIVEDARKSARESSVLLYVDAVKLAYSEEMLKNTGKPLKELADSKMSGGNKVSCEVATYVKDKGVLLSGCTVGEDTTKYYYFNGLSTEMSAEISAYLGETKCVKVTNVTAGVLATEENPYVLGGEYNCTLGDGETRTFFVLEEGTDTVSLIMDRNLGSNVAWLSEDDYLNNYQNNTLSKGDIGPITALNYLYSLTDEWGNVTVSLPTKTQINNNIENNNVPSWLTVGLTLLPLDLIPIKGESYAYHINYPGDEDLESVNLLKTMTLFGIDSMISHVPDPEFGGGAIGTAPTNDDRVGVRPVITISKDLLK